MSCDLFIVVLSEQLKKLCTDLDVIYSRILEDLWWNSLTWCDRWKNGPVNTKSEGVVDRRRTD